MADEIRARRQWTGEQAHEAINRLVEAAYGKHDHFPLHIPGRPDDADVLLHDCIDELQALRQQAARWSEPSGHTWKVEALFDGFLRRTEAYTGNDFREMCLRTGEMCLSTTTDKVFVERDGEQYRHIEVH